MWLLALASIPDKLVNKVSQCSRIARLIKPDQSRSIKYIVRHAIGNINTVGGLVALNFCKVRRNRLSLKDSSEVLLQAIVYIGIGATKGAAWKFAILVMIIWVKLSLGASKAAKLTL